MGKKQASVNGIEHEIADGETLATLLAKAAGGNDGPFVVSVNGEHVPRTLYARTVLEGGERVEMLTVRQGG